MLIESPESWIGEEIEGFLLESVLGHGKIGYVFLARHRSISTNVRACKIIKDGGLKFGWQKEIEKVGQLEGVPQIVEVISWGNQSNRKSEPFSYINYRYVDGTNLKSFLQANPTPPLPVILAIGEALLRAKHACDMVGVNHGDLHEGNILITKPDPRLPENAQRIVVTDFGYGGSHNSVSPKNDLAHISSIMCGLLKRTPVDRLEATDRSVRERLIEFFGKELTDTYRNDAEPPKVTRPGVPMSLFDVFQSRLNQAKVEAANARKGVFDTNADDYLNAEALGHRKEEWQNLFVPEILGASAFTSRNITVITGARGCGKTMAFRRLTLFLDELIGSPSGVQGADNILGFYLNCRDIVEAFPYTGPKLGSPQRKQITHFFHLCWLHEIFRAFSQHALREQENFTWIVRWLEQLFQKRLMQPPGGYTDVLTFVLAFVGDEKERCRTTPLGKNSSWPLDRIDLLDNFYSMASENVSWIQSKPFFLFLDDYTIPMLSEQLQSTLNTVVFKRRAGLFFKVSTEASNSFLRLVGKKPLEVSHDFDLVDLANETLHVHDDVKHKLLDSIFRHRIRRIEGLKESNLGLRDILGTSEWASYNDLARRLRDARGASSTPVYFGDKAFVGMWSSDIRSMIQLFNELMRPFRTTDSMAFPIAGALQQSRYSESGGEFLNLTETVRSAGFWDGETRSGKGPKNFGKSLRDIVTAFVAVCRYELMEQPLMSNQNSKAPTQAFRIEIVDELQLSPHVRIEVASIGTQWEAQIKDDSGTIRTSI